LDGEKGHGEIIESKCRNVEVSKCREEKDSPRRHGDAEEERKGRKEEKRFFDKAGEGIGPAGR
jgi:hypothetical protein